MTARETIATLAAACRRAAVDPVKVFEHLDRIDLDEYQRHHAAGHLPADVLACCMRAAVDAAEAGRCTCSRCQTRRAQS